MPHRTSAANEARIATLKLHLRYLQSVAANPASLNAEIARRKNAIAKQQAEIDRMENLKTTVHDKIDEVETEIRNLRASALIKKYLNLFLEVHRASAK